MSSPNTFVVVDCKSRKVIFVTASARKAGAILQKGFRVEVWNNGTKLETLYSHSQEEGRHSISSYIQMEREYIGRKQARAEQRNRRRRDRNVK